MLISHIHSHNNLIIKTIHCAINITTTEAKFFKIRCSINQAIGISNINCIFVITDSLHAAKQIFDSSSHPYQIQFVAIFHKLREFFKENINNHIEFWNCSSNQNWSLHRLVDNNTKRFDFSLIFPCKLSWDFSKKLECDLILVN